MLRILAAVVVLAAVSTGAQAQIFTVVTIQNIPGESNLPGYQDSIDVLNWSQSVSNVNQTPVVLPLEFVHFVDLASPKLVEATLLGNSLGSATLTVLKNVEGALELSSEIKLLDARVVSVAAAGVDGGDRPLETVRLTCSSFTFSYRLQNDDGSFEPPIDTTGNCGN